MKITTNILGQLGRAVGLSRTGGFETTLTVPPLLSPTMEMREPLQNGVTAAIGASPVQRMSFGVSQMQTVANAAGAGVTLARLGAGVWQLNWMCHYTSNFISVAAQFGAALILSQAAGAQQYFLCSFLPTGAGAQQSQSESGLIEISSAVDIDLINNVATNGVGQTHSLLTVVIAHKLL